MNLMEEIKNSAAVWPLTTTNGTKDPQLWFAKEQELMHDVVQLEQTTATTQVPTQLIKDLMRANKQATITQFDSKMSSGLFLLGGLMQRMVDSILRWYFLSDSKLLIV